MPAVQRTVTLPGTWWAARGEAQTLEWGDAVRPFVAEAEDETPPAAASRRPPPAPGRAPWVAPLEAWGSSGNGSGSSATQVEQRLPPSGSGSEVPRGGSATGTTPQMSSYDRKRMAAFRSAFQSVFTQEQHAEETEKRIEYTPASSAD